jgi:hypothetical protein
MFKNTQSSKLVSSKFTPPSFAPVQPTAQTVKNRVKFLRAALRKTVFDDILPRTEEDETINKA